MKFIGFVIVILIFELKDNCCKVRFMNMYWPTMKSPNNLLRSAHVSVLLLQSLCHIEREARTCSRGILSDFDKS
jgi:hypothetical protein